MKTRQTTTTKRKASFTSSDAIPARWYHWEKWFPYHLVGASLVGLLASFALALEKIASLQNPNRTTLCDINPIMSCSSVMDSAQASVFGIPHSLIGIAIFGGLTAVGLVILLHGTLSNRLWWVLLSGFSFGFISVQYLVIQSIFILQALCPWCMVIWLVVVPLVFGAIAYCWRRSLITVKQPMMASVLRWLSNHGAAVLLVWFIVVLYAIIWQFWYYWETLL